MVGGSIEHRPGKKHCNADGLSRRPDPLTECDCYQAGKNVNSLPCGGCAYCQRASEQWDRFTDDVDDIVPLAIRKAADVESIEDPADETDSELEEITENEEDDNQMSPEQLAELHVNVSSDSPSFAGTSATTLLDHTVQGIIAQDGEVRDLRISGEVSSDTVPSEEISRTPMSNWAVGMTATEVHEHQREDPDLRPILDWLEADTEPEQHELFLASPATKALWLCNSHLLLRNGVLHYRWENHPLREEVLVVPKGLHEVVLRECHDAKVAGHLGQSKTYLRVQQKFMWRNMAHDCREYVKSCHICNINKKPQTRPRAGLGSYHAGFPMERVHLDILGPFVTSRQGNKYILCMVDQFTKWIELAAVPDQTAEVIAQRFLVHFITTFGCPLEVHTDQGRNFTGNLFKALCDLLQIAKTRTTPYRPCSNGQVETYNRVVLQFVRCFSEGRPDCWDECLPMLMMALHSMVHRQTGYTANRLMLGREVLQPVDLLLGTLDRQRLAASPAEWLTQLADTLERVHTFVRQNLRTSQALQKRDYDLRIRENQFGVGDLVYRLDSSTKVGAKALKPIWKGPYVVIRAQPPLYKLQDRKKTGVWHHDKLKICKDRHVPFWLRRLRSRILASHENEEEVLTDGTLLDADDSGFEVLEKNWEGELRTYPAPKNEVRKPTTSPTNDDAVDANPHVRPDVVTGVEEGTTPQETDKDRQNKEGNGYPRTRKGRRTRRPAYLEEYDLLRETIV